MNKIKFKRNGTLVLKKANQTAPIKRGSYWFGSWTDSPIAIKTRMIAAGYCLQGVRQKRSITSAEGAEE